MMVAAFYVLFAASMVICAGSKDGFVTGKNVDRSYLMKSISCKQRCHETRSHGDVTVDCTNAKCTDVPDDLSSDTTRLILVKNYIRVIKKTAFVSLVNLVYLDISYGQIQTIQDGCFETLAQLQFLNLSYNSDIESLPEGIFSPLINLKELNLKSTQRICTFNQSLFENLRQLEMLAYNENRLTLFPRFQRKRDNKPLLPKLKELSLRRNNIEFIAVRYLRGLENSLETLNLNENRIRRISAYAFAAMKKLRRLQLDKNNIRVIECFAFKSQSLRFLSIVYSDFRMKSGKKCQQNILNNTPNLRDLILARAIGFRRASMPFSSQKHLESLSVQDTVVYEADLRRIVKALPMLRRLDLYNNRIASSNADLWNDLELTELDIGHNMITNINITSFPPKMWSSLKRVSFAGNPFYCDCSLVWFRQWLQNTNATIIKSNLTLCSGPPERKAAIVADTVRPTPSECFTADYDWTLLATFLLYLTIVATTAVTSILHKFRWYLKYWYFKTKNKAMRLREFLDETEYEFDAFLSYSESDSRWVIDTLCQVLENQYNLRLCVHHRDWMIGRDIVTNIIDSIEKSRKTLMIVTNAFAASQWCHFEMTMAQTKLFEDDRDNLVLVLLEEIADCNMNPRLQLQMQKKTYVEWTENPVGQQLFWEKLRQAISTGSTSVVNSVPPQELFVSTEEN